MKKYVNTCVFNHLVFLFFFYSYFVKFSFYFFSLMILWCIHKQLVSYLSIHIRIRCVKHFCFKDEIFISQFNIYLTLVFYFSENI